MKFRVGRAKFAALLNHVAPLASRRFSSADIVACVRITLEDEQLTLTATDLSCMVSVYMDVNLDGEAEGDLCVDGQRLSSAIGALPKDADILIERKGGTLRISSGRARFSLPVLSAESFPELSQGEAVTRTTIDGAELSRLLSQTVPCVSRDETRKYLTGVLIEAGSIDNAGDQESLCFIGIDGRHAAIRSTPATATGWPGIILHRDHCKYLAKVCAESEAVSLSVRTADGYRLAVEFDGAQMLFLLVEGTPAPWRNALYETYPPKSGYCHERSELQRAIQTAATGLERGRAYVTLSVDLGGETEVSSGKAEDGDEAAKDACRHRIEGEPGVSTFSLNPGMLATVLSVMSGDEVLVSPHEAMNSPVLVTDPADPSAINFVMRYRA